MSQSNSKIEKQTKYDQEHHNSREGNGGLWMLLVSSYEEPLGLIGDANNQKIWTVWKARSQQITFRISQIFYIHF